MAELKDTKTLYMVFLGENDKKISLSLDNPKDNLTKTEVDAVMQKIVDTQAIIASGVVATAIGTAYIQTVTQDPLV